MKLKNDMPPRTRRDTDRLPLVLILCTANSCRSQMAEGVLKAVASDFMDVASAGSEPSGFVHPLAIAVMREIGIDISSHHSKSVTDFLQKDVDTVITVCGKADEACPMFPGDVRRYHWPFNDPAKVGGTEEQKLAAFRKIRDEIRTVFEAYATGQKDGLRGLEQ